MKLMGWEPRSYAMINSHTDAVDNFRNDIELPWYNNYGALVSANLVLKALQNGVAIPGPTDTSSNAMIRAAARFMQGAALSMIALNYDSGYVFDETYDPAQGALPLVGRKSVDSAALVKLDNAISLATTTGSWAIPNTFLSQGANPWTNVQLAQIANYWAARTLAYFPHNVTENNAVNWAKVLSYASKGNSSGTPFDAVVGGDGGNNWWDDYLGIADAFFDWARVSERTVCLFQAGYACHHANDNRQDSIPQTADYRFNGDDVVGDNCVPTDVAAAIKGVDPSGSSYGAHCSAASKVGGADFFYADNQYGATWTGFPASRGYWRYSNVSHVRYFDIGWDGPVTAQGNMTFVAASENDLLWAEALVQTGNLAGAAALINNSRVTRGHLPAATAAEGKDSLMAHIRYEKAIELYGIDPYVDWYDARRWAADLNPSYAIATTPGSNDQTGWLPYGQGMQPGSVRLLPVPQQELALIGHNVYTYGGTTAAEPPAPPARGVAAVRGSSSIFGTTADGRPILGLGDWASTADRMEAAAVRHGILNKKM
jgi:hypothetical protein